MHDAFGTVLWVVCIGAFVVAVVAFASSGKTWNEFGKDGLLLDSEFTGGAHRSAAALRERDEEIRQMLEARNARRIRRGEQPLDVEEEFAKLTAPVIDPELRAEIADLVIARNYRRARAGNIDSTSKRRSSARSPSSGISEERPLRGPAFRVRCLPMADPRKFEVDELVNRPGTYFDPQTQVLVVVDDSPDMDSKIFNMEEYEGADWVLISDDLPVDQNRRDELLETFQVRYHPGSITADSDDELNRTTRRSVGSRPLGPCRPGL